MKVVKTFVVFSIAFFFLMVIIGSMISPTSSTGSYTPGAYSQCKHSPATGIVVAEYRQQYPQLSYNQIAHILCKDAK